MKNLPLILAAATAAAASFSIAAASDEAEYRRATREELRLLEAGRFAPEIPEAAGSIMRSLDNGTSGESLRESSSLEFRKEKESGASQKGKEKERRHGSAGGSFVSGKYRAALSLAVLRLLILRKARSTSSLSSERHSSLGLPYLPRGEPRSSRRAPAPGSSPGSRSRCPLPCSQRFW